MGFALLFAALVNHLQHIRDRRAFFPGFIERHRLTIAAILQARGPAGYFRNGTTVQQKIFYFLRQLFTNGVFRGAFLHGMAKPGDE